MRRLLALVLTGGLAWAAIAAHDQDNTPAASPPAAVDTAPGRGVDAISPAALRQASTQLAALAVKGRAPKSGYARSQFGPRWSDNVNVELGRDGCDTQGNLLNRDLEGVTTKPGTRGCVVLTGRLADPYTGQTISYRRGQSPALVNLDHVVSLGDSWQKGAQQLTADQRRDFANDPINLLAVSASANASKGEGDAATWLPPNRGFWCVYAARQIRVKARYHLWVTPAEKVALSRLLTSCTQNGDPR